MNEYVYDYQNVRRLITLPRSFAKFGIKSRDDYDKDVLCELRDDGLAQLVDGGWKRTQRGDFLVGEMIAHVNLLMDHFEERKAA
jgi:hypothetical protein